MTAWWNVPNSLAFPYCKLESTHGTHASSTKVSETHRGSLMPQILIPNGKCRGLRFSHICICLRAHPTLRFTGQTDILFLLGLLKYIMARPVQHLAESVARRDMKLRQKFTCFRVLILGRANAGKTTILQKVCNTDEQPEIFNSKGEKVSDLSIRNWSFRESFAFRSIPLS
jgi:hypothetical protein